MTEPKTPNSLQKNAKDVNKGRSEKGNVMNIDRVQKPLGWAIIISETSHVFCCIMPTIFSIVSLATGLGLLAAMPAWMVVLHDMMHDWEIPVIIFSGVVVALGWALYVFSKRIDCHDPGCVHEPCGRVKKEPTRS
jgi:hypothetical protein